MRLGARLDHIPLPQLPVEEFVETCLSSAERVDLSHETSIARRIRRLLLDVAIRRFSDKATPRERDENRRDPSYKRRRYSRQAISVSAPKRGKASAAPH